MLCAACELVASTGTAGVIVVAVAGIVVAAGIYLASRRRPVTPDSVVNDEIVVDEPLKVAA